MNATPVGLERFYSVIPAGGNNITLQTSQGSIGTAAAPLVRTRRGGLRSKTLDGTSKCLGLPHPGERCDRERS